MFFRGWFSTAIAIKKAVVSSLVLAAGGSLLHLVVLKPEIDSSRAKDLIGSKPFLDKRKGNPYRLQHGDSFAGGFAKTSATPSILPRLVVEDLNKDTKSRYLSKFNRPLREHIKKNEEVKYIWTNKFSNPNTPFQKSADSLANYKWEMATISAIDIPYKSNFFVGVVNSLTKSQIIQDLLWSLAEESHENKFSIRPESIKIDFSLEKVSIDLFKEKDTDIFPLPANRLRNFKLRFKVFNPTQRLVHVFKTIPIEPVREKEVHVQINSAEIRPFAIGIANRYEFATKWGLLPTDNNRFDISVYEFFPRLDTRFFKFPSLSLMYGRSRFISDSIGGPPASRLINAPIYLDFQNIADNYLVGITAQQVKDDLETWYGVLSAFYFRLALQDVRKFFKILEMPIMTGKDNRKYSALKNFVKYPQWRTNLYNWAKIDEKARQILDYMFENSGDSKNKNPVTEEELQAMLKSLSKQLSELEKNMKITFTWDEEPILITSTSEDSSPYPSVSFSFSQKISWDKEIVIPFKGCWEGDSSSYSSTTEKSSCTGSNKTWFDLSQKLEGLQILLEPIQNVIPGRLFKLLPNAEKFIGWEKWVIGADEEIVNRYTAKNSPIRPAITQTSDFYSKTKMIAGWKAIDVALANDFSKFHKFVHSVYSKIDEYKDHQEINLNGIRLLSALQTEKQKQIADNLITFVVHAINQTFDAKYWTKNKSEEDKRPWTVFFKTLLQRPFNFDSTQVFAGYSRSMFNVPNWVLNNTKETNSPDNGRSGSSGGNIYKVSKDLQSKDVHKGSVDISDKDWDFPAIYKSEELKDIMDNYQNTFSSNFPKYPMIFDVQNNDKWNLFLSKEGATTTGLIRYRDYLKTIIMDAVYNNTDPKNPGSRLKRFPSKNFIDWKKIKISATSLDLEKALKSVLNLPNQWGAILNFISGIQLNSSLGDAIQRDPMWITVNMMTEDGIFLFSTKPIVIARNSVYSVYQFGVGLNFDVNKLSNAITKHLKNLKK